MIPMIRNHWERTKRSKIAKKKDRATGVQKRAEKGASFRAERGRGN